MYNFLRQGFENVPTVHGPHGEVILNLSKRELDRIEPVPSNVNVLILDQNYIRRLENLGNLYDLQQVCLSSSLSECMYIPNPSSSHFLETNYCRCMEWPVWHIWPF